MAYLLPATAAGKQAQQENSRKDQDAPAHCPCAAISVPVIPLITSCWIVPAATLDSAMLRTGRGRLRTGGISRMGGTAVGREHVANPCSTFLCLIAHYTTNQRKKPSALIGRWGVPILDGLPVAVFRGSTLDPKACAGRRRYQRPCCTAVLKLPRPSPRSGLLGVRCI